MISNARLWPSTLFESGGVWPQLPIRDFGRLSLSRHVVTVLDGSRPNCNHLTSRSHQSRSSCSRPAAFAPALSDNVKCRQPVFPSQTPSPRPGTWESAPVYQMLRVEASHVRSCRGIVATHSSRAPLLSGSRLARRPAAPRCFRHAVRSL